MPCEYGCEQFPLYEEKCPACQAAIDASEETRESHKDAMAASDDFDVSQPPIGSYAYTARCLVELGILSGDEADAWKDQMKDESLMADDAAFRGNG